MTSGPQVKENAWVNDGSRFAPANDNERVGNWLQTFTGGKFYPMDPRAAEMRIEDVAHSLSMQCRYAGHCLQFYCVAEHSVLIERWLAARGEDQATRLKGLLHDAPETWLVDVPRPVKPSLIGYKEAEAAVWKQVCYWHGMSDLMPDIVHEADNRILNDERAQNMGPCEDAWGYSGDPLGITLEFWSPARAEAEFLAAYWSLIETGVL